MPFHFFRNIGGVLRTLAGLKISGADIAPNTILPESIAPVASGILLGRNGESAGEIEQIEVGIGLDLSGWTLNTAASQICTSLLVVNGDGEYSPVDGFYMYSKDSGLNNACPTFKTENGTVIVLNQSLSTTAAVQHAMLGIGVTPSYLLHASQTMTDDAIAVYAAYIRSLTTVTATAARSNTGLVIDNTYQAVAAGQSNTGTVVGINASTQVNTLNFAGSVTTQVANRAMAGIVRATAGAAIANVYGYYTFVYNSIAGTTITNAYGLYVDVTQNAGTITNRWGVYIDTGVYGGNYFSTNIGLGVSSFGTNATKTLAIGSGTPPGSSPADAFQLYSADQAAGNACPHFRTENGGIVKLYQQAAIADAAGGDEVAKINAILGVLRNAGLIGT